MISTADGLCELVLSNDDDELYLILGREDWSAPPPIKTTLRNATGIATVPFATAADVNSDGSADMMLLPDPDEAEERGMDARALYDLGFVAQSALYVGQAPRAIPADAPMRSLASVGLKATPSDLYVDDDYCALCNNDGYSWGVNAFDSLPSAMAVAGSQGDTIHLRPGVYPAFTVGAGLDNLAIEGVDPDAVFIDGADGPFAVKFENVRGITLSEVTLRNADHGLWLDDAGLLGHETPAYRCALQGSLIHDCDQAIYSDRSSSIDVSDCTLGTDGQPTHPLIAVDASEPDPDLYQWSSLQGSPTDISLGGGLYAGPNAIYALPGGNTSEVFSYDLGAGTWHSETDVPSPLPEAATAAVDENDDLWVLCPDEFGGFGSPVRSLLVESPTNIELGTDKARWEYDGNAWENAASGANTLIKEIDGVVYYCDGGSVSRRETSGTVTTLGYLTFFNTNEAFATDVAVDGDYVYVAGDFDQIDYWDDDLGQMVRMGAHNIARWHPTNGWQTMGHPDADGLRGPSTINSDCYGVDYVNSLLIKGDYLYVGGFFYSGTNVGTGGVEVLVGSHAVIRYHLENGTWAQIKYESSTSGGIQIWEEEWVNGVCDTTVIVHELVDWDSDTLLIAGMFPHYGRVEGTAWNIAFYNVNSDSWESIPGWAKTDGPIHTIERNGDDYYFGGDFGQVGGSVAAQHVARFDRGTSTWYALTGGVNGPVHALDYATDNHTLYVGGDFTSADGVGHYCIARWDEDSDQWPGGQYLYRYHDDLWAARAPMPALAGLGACMSANDDGYLYVLAGDHGSGFYRYSIAGNTWESQPGLNNITKGSALTSADGTLYALTGAPLQQVHKFAGGNWQSAIVYPNTTPETGSGADLVWDGLESLYALTGMGTDSLWRFSIPDGTWIEMEDPGLSAFATYGHGLIRRDQSLCAHLTPMGSADSFYRCTRVGVPNKKLALERNALIAPAGASSPVWLEPGALHTDYALSDPVSSTWVADVEWSPSVPEDDTLRTARADLVDPPASLYRAGRRSQLESGYRPHIGEVRVSPTYCPHLRQRWPYLERRCL